MTEVGRTTRQFLRQVGRLSLAAAAWVVLMAVRLTLSLRAHRPVRRFRPTAPVRPSPGTDRGGRRNRLGPGRVERAVNAADRYLSGTTCLVRSLAAGVLLDLLGRRPVLRFAVLRARDGDGLRAHAWVEDGTGRPLYGSAPEEGVRLG